jgi:hypothetical protein
VGEGLTEEVALEALVYKAYVVRYLANHLRYVKEVGEKIGLDEALKVLAKTQWEQGRNWFKVNKDKLDIDKDDAIAGLVLLKRAIKTLVPVVQDPENYKVVEESPRKSILKVSGWSPILEASEQVRLDNKDVYTHYALPYFEAMIKTLNPKLSLKLTKIRPEKPCYEFVIELEE